MSDDWEEFRPSRVGRRFWRVVGLVLLIVFVGLLAWRAIRPLLPAA